MPSKKLGKDAIVGDNTGSFGSPAWRANKWIQDLSRTEEPGAVIDSTDRFASAVTKLATRFNLSYDFNGIWQANTSQLKMRTAFLAGTSLDLAVLDRAATTSGVGHRGEFLFKKFAFEFPLQGEQKLAVTIVPYGNYTTAQQVAVYTDATGSPGTADAAGTRKLGKNASLNNSGGTPVTGARDIKLSLEWNLADANDRAIDFNAFLATQLMLTAEFDVIWDATDATITAFRTAYNAHSAYDGYILDGAYATSGSWGVHSDWEVTSFAWKAALKEGQLYNVKLEPHGNATTLPTFVTL